MSNRYQKLPSADQPPDNHPLQDTEPHTSALIPTPTHDQPNNGHVRDQQQTDLEATFGESLDDLDSSETQRLMTDTATHANEPPSPQPSLPSHSHRPAVLPVTNDGVFSNMSAKPERESVKVDETPPAYEEAAMDSTPPYWQTTVIAPAGMGDMILVEGMPVGHILGFAWNLLVSASFQFVGFMLTYLLHTSHAAKQGSRAGLGISLVQTGFYIKSRGSLSEDFGDGGEKEESGDQNSLDADIVSYLLMILGWFIIIRAIVDYQRARKLEKIIRSEPSAENIV